MQLLRQTILETVYLLFNCFNLTTVLLLQRILFLFTYAKIEYVSVHVRTCPSKNRIRTQYVSSSLPDNRFIFMQQSLQRGIMFHLVSPVVRPDVCPVPIWGQAALAIGQPDGRRPGTMAIGQNAV